VLCILCCAVLCILCCAVMCILCCAVMCILCCAVMCLRSKVFFDSLRFMLLFKFSYKLPQKACSVIQANHIHIHIYVYVPPVRLQITLCCHKNVSLPEEVRDKTRSTALLNSGQCLGASAAAAPSVCGRRLQQPSVSGDVGCSSPGQESIGPG
jgi:hypothetical protein